MTSPFTHQSVLAAEVVQAFAGYPPGDSDGAPPS